MNRNFVAVFLLVAFVISAKLIGAAEEQQVSRTAFPVLRQAAEVD